MCFGLSSIQSQQIKYFWLNGFKRKKRVDHNSHFMAKVLRGVALLFKISGCEFLLINLVTHFQKESQQKRIYSQTEQGDWFFYRLL